MRPHFLACHAAILVVNHASYLPQLIVGCSATRVIDMAPEMREADEAKGPKADVFSAGVVAIEMSSGREPSPVSSLWLTRTSMAPLVY